MSWTYFWEIALLHAHYKLFQQIWQNSLMCAKFTRVFCEMYFLPDMGFTLNVRCNGDQNRYSLTPMGCSFWEEEPRKASWSWYKAYKESALGAFSVVMTFTNPRILSLWESYFVTCREWMYSRWQWLEWIFLQNATRYLVMIFSYFLFLWCQNLLTF